MLKAKCQAMSRTKSEKKDCEKEGYEGHKALKKPTNQKNLYQAKYPK